ncbi:MAG: bis-aminopropyl spermidine synthase family protein [Promethearchaeota archaeon]
MEFLKQLQEKIPIQEGTEGFRTILREIYRAGHISLQDLSYQSLLPIPVLSKIVNFLMEKEILDRVPEGILYTENGMKYIESELKFYGFGISECDECDSLPIWISPRWDPIVDSLETIFASRPTVDTKLDQAFADTETSLQRALLLYRNGSLEGKKIAFLGDDDYTSIAVGKLYEGFFPEEPQLIPRQAVVFDIDTRLLKGIKENSQWEPPEFSTESWDYRKPVPTAYTHHFDVVMVDPPYSFPGLELVLSRAIGLLLTGSGKEIYLSFAHRSPSEMWKMQQLFTSLGLTIMELYPRFNYYEGAQILGNITQMYRLVTTDHTSSSKLPVKTTETWDKPIYTGELHPNLRNYYCSSCKKGIQVGSSVKINTIEQLKKEGCPHCQSTGPFELEGKESVTLENIKEELKEDVEN